LATRMVWVGCPGLGSIVATRLKRRRARLREKRAKARPVVTAMNSSPKKASTVTTRFTQRLVGWDPVTDGAQGLDTEEEGLQHGEPSSIGGPADAIKIQRIEQREGEMEQEVAGGDAEQKARPGNGQHEAIGLAPVAVQAPPFLRMEHPAPLAQPFRRSTDGPIPCQRR
jgi:hypothetical protein